MWRWWVSLQLTGRSVLHEVGVRDGQRGQITERLVVLLGESRGSVAHRNARPTTDDNSCDFEQPKHIGEV